MSKETKQKADELRKKIRQEFFSYEDGFIKEGMDNTMLHIEEYFKAKLESITDEVMDNNLDRYEILGAKWLKQKLLKDES